MLICVVIVWTALKGGGKRRAALSESLHAAKYSDPASRIPPKRPPDSASAVLRQSQAWRNLETRIPT
jgi:hypothetical protein